MKRLFLTIPSSISPLIHLPVTSRLKRCSSLHRRSFSSTTFSDGFWESPSVVDVTPLANSIRTNVRAYAQQHSSLKMVGILAEAMGPIRRNDAALYSHRIQETLADDGIDYELWTCKNGNMEEYIQKANLSNEIHGILIFYPVYPMGPKGPYKNKATGVFYKTQDDYFRDIVDPEKDVEGLCGTPWLYHTTTLKQQQQQPPLVYPCTAMSVRKILEYYHLKSFDENSCRGGWENQVISVINRSEILGWPLAAMMAALGATVYSIDIDSILRFQPDGGHSRCSNDTSLEDCLAESNIIVTGVPDPNFQLPLEIVADGTTVVNVSEFSNVCEDRILRRPDVMYIPQVGKVTVAVLGQNLVRLHHKAITA